MNNDKLREALRRFTVLYYPGEEKKRAALFDGLCSEVLSFFPAPASVDDKAIAEAMVQVAEVRYRTNSVDGHAIDTVVTALRSALLEVAQLQEWKRQQLEVESTWDTQAVGKLLGVPLGKSIRPAIAPGIEALQAEVARKQAVIERMEELHAKCMDGTCSCYSDVDGVCTRCNNSTRLRELAEKESEAGEGKGAT